MAKCSDFIFKYFPLFVIPNAFYPFLNFNFTTNLNFYSISKQHETHATHTSAQILFIHLIKGGIQYFYSRGGGVFLGNFHQENLRNRLQT